MGEDRKIREVTFARLGYEPGGDGMSAKRSVLVEPDYYVVVFKRRRFDYYIDRNHLGLERGEHVLVQVERGRDIGRIVSPITREYFEAHSQHKYPLEILRRATPEDLERLARLREMEREVIKTCQEFVDFRGLRMKLVDAEYQFDGRKLTIYFTAEERVDFRELVKDLAATYRTRIELRQIGVRDEVKMVGGIGPCGRITCCSLFMKQFVPISTQMARMQNLVLNPAKISGLCERLMCCLAFEMDYYERVREEYPEVGGEYDVEGGGKMVVEAVDHFRDRITVRFGEGEEPRVMSLVEFKKLLAGRKDFIKKWVGEGCARGRSDDGRRGKGA